MNQPPLPSASLRRRRLAGLALVWLAAWIMIAAARPLAIGLVRSSGDDPARRGWRVTAKQDSVPSPSLGERLELKNPHSSLKAVAVWPVAQEGRWRMLLDCDNYGRVWVDGQPVLWRQDPTPGHPTDFHNDLQPGGHLLLDNKVALEPGPHLVEVALTNVTDQGFLRIEVRPPNQSKFKPLAGRNLWFPSIRGAFYLLSGAEVIRWLGVVLLIATAGLLAAWHLAWDAAAAAWAPDQAAAELARRKARIDRLAETCAQHLDSLDLLTSTGRATDALLLAAPLVEDCQEASRLISHPQPAPAAVTRLGEEIISLVRDSAAPDGQVEPLAEKILALGASLVRQVRRQREQASVSLLCGPGDVLRSQVRNQSLVLVGFGFVSAVVFMVWAL